MSKTRDGRAHQEFLDSSQYTINGVERYEVVFGRGFVSSGGKKTTDAFLDEFELPENARVLDVGCGIGGSMFALRRRFPTVTVLGVDLSKNMIDLAHQRLDENPDVADGLEFLLGDIFTVDLPLASFDLVYSRDCFLHVHDKEGLAKRLATLTKPGGRIFWTDYVAPLEADQDAEMKAYLDQRGYCLVPVVENVKRLEAGAGDLIENVEGKDLTELWKGVLQEELMRMEEVKSQLTEKDYNDLKSGWATKVERVERGQQGWGSFSCYRKVNQ
mmetsp:Transcript_13843/g.39386  ORF Transcript_13843/g.39386 Transcript_13843/m.39386 type:complete len:272 (+) Transcript_13843:157-972(+)|eukprot:CAMPEP_0119127694 /NCGR_PEP_ID=MMETSP1310-20130426/6139_1 /TAXON_ID=464262 /ORGANISM="Genus nov. species nov., Strain RCC2339" /LENGTH=271 /DNA_ID=CAMNT_0007117973 /DNA_START=131 /DNA_END=946 /DNA_ORIENTATION=+